MHCVTIVCACVCRYKQRALEWHPDKWSDRSPEEQKVAQRRFQELGAYLEVSVISVLVLKGIKLSKWRFQELGAFLEVKRRVSRVSACYCGTCAADPMSRL